MRQCMCAESSRIEDAAIVNDDHDIANMHAYAAEDNDAESPLDSSLSASPELVYAAVLPKPSLIDGSFDEFAVQALVDIIQPDQRVDHNDAILASAFAQLFMLGKGVPTGSIPKTQLRHCFLFYNGCFEDPLFVATTFNQLQRHACVRSTAQISAKRAKQLEKLGELTNSSVFRERLVWVRDNPLLDEAKKLNVTVCRILSMVGATVLFSLFERVVTCPKMTAMRLRYGIGGYFLTGARPNSRTTLYRATP
ncbi:unnamed protein product [Lampetra fluviatilis]